MALEVAKSVGAAAIGYVAPMIATKTWQFVKKYPLAGLALGSYLTGAYVNTFDFEGFTHSAHDLGKDAGQILLGVQALKEAYKLKDSTFWNCIRDYITSKKDTQGVKWGEKVAPLPNLEAYSSDDVSPIDGVYKEYLEWTKQRLERHADYKTNNDKYLTLLAYVFTSNDIRSTFGVEFGNLNVRLGFVHETSVIIKDGCLKYLCSFPFNDVDESIAWVKTLDKLKYFKTLGAEPQRIEVCTLDESGTVKEGPVGTVLETIDLISLNTLKIDDKPSLTKQVAQTRYMAPLVGKSLEPHQTPILKLPDGFEAYNWILNAYFGDKKLYQKFLPSYQMCNDFVTHVVTNFGEDTKAECMSNLQRLVSNTVPLLNVPNQRVWNLELSLPSVYNTDTTLPAELCGADVTTSTHRVIVESENIIVANTVRCATYKAKEGQDNQLLLGQAILLRVLYVIKVLLLVTKSDSFSFDKNSLVQIAKCDILSGLANINYGSEVLKVYTELDLNYPRTTLETNMFDSSTAPQTTEYTSHLKHYVPKLLGVSSLAELNEVVDAMTNGENSIKNLLANEIAQKITQKDKQKGNYIRERLATFTTSLTQSDSLNEALPDLTNLATFVNIATLQQTPEADQLSYALRVVYVCCKVCRVLEDESNFGTSVVFKASRYDVADLSGFTTQHEYDVRMRDNKYRHEDERTRSNSIKQELHEVGRRITSSKHAREHEKFQTAINAIYKDDTKPEPFSSFGYVVYFVRWLASVVAGIGQFQSANDGGYIDLLIKEDSGSVVFEFSIKDV